MRTVQGAGPQPHAAIDAAQTDAEFTQREQETAMPTIGAVRGMPPVFARGDWAGGRYRVVRFVAAGGMGQVFEVADRELDDERLALKTLNPTLAGRSAAANQFKVEIQLARKVTHPNVCRIFDVGYHAFADGGEPPS